MVASNILVEFSGLVRAVHWYTSYQKTQKTLFWAKYLEESYMDDAINTCLSGNYGGPEVQSRTANKTVANQKIQWQIICQFVVLLISPLRFVDGWFLICCFRICYCVLHSQISLH